MRIESYFPEYVLAEISEKSDGSCSRTDPASALNRARFFAGRGIAEARVVSPALIHSPIIEFVEDDPLRERVCDGLITNVPGIYLTVEAADCPSIFLVDPVTRSVGLLHAGWRGIASNIVHYAISAMATRFGSNPANLQAFIGPGIRSCHFEVQKDVWDQLVPFLYPNSAGMGVAPAFVDGQRNSLDLSHAILMQLIQNGLNPSAHNVRLSFGCTFCQHNQWFSWRRDKTGDRMMAVIGMRETMV